MTSRNRCSVYLLFALSTLWIALAGCSGSSGGGGGGGNPTGPSPGIFFTRDQAAGNGSIAMDSGPGTSSPRFELQVVALSVTNVQTVDFELTYPPNLLQFDGARQEDFLGLDAPLVVTPLAAGTLAVSLTRAVPGGVTGSGVILSFDFQALAAGEGPLTFVEPEALDPFGLDIPTIEWIGGSIQIVF